MILFFILKLILMLAYVLSTMCVAVD